MRHLQTTSDRGGGVGVHLWVRICRRTGHKARVAEQIRCPPQQTYPSSLHFFAPGSPPFRAPCSLYAASPPYSSDAARNNPSEIEIAARTQHQHACTRGPSTTININTTHDNRQKVRLKTHHFQTKLCRVTDGEPECLHWLAAPIHPLDNGERPMDFGYRTFRTMTFFRIKITHGSHSFDSQTASQCTVQLLGDNMGKASVGAQRRQSRWSTFSACATIVPTDSSTPPPCSGAQPQGGGMFCAGIVNQRLFNNIHLLGLNSNDDSGTTANNDQLLNAGACDVNAWAQSAKYCVRNPP